MYFNKYFNNNKIPVSYKELINNDIQKAFDYYIHLPVFFKQNFLFSRFKCKHENVLLFHIKWLSKLNERKICLNKIINLGLIIEFLINNEYRNMADDIIDKLKKNWFHLEYEEFIFCLNEYRTAYTLKNKKNVKTKKYELIKVYDLEKRCRFLRAIQQIEYRVLDIFNKPVDAFTLTWIYESYLFNLFIFEDFIIEKKIEKILELFIDKNNLIKNVDYFFSYKEKEEKWGKEYLYEKSNIHCIIEKFENNF